MGWRLSEKGREGDGGVDVERESKSSAVSSDIWVGVKTPEVSGGGSEEDSSANWKLETGGSERESIIDARESGVTWTEAALPGGGRRRRGGKGEGEGGESSDPAGEGNGEGHGHRWGGSCCR